MSPNHQVRAAAKVIGYPPFPKSPNGFQFCARLQSFRHLVNRLQEGGEGDADGFHTPARKSLFGRKREKDPLRRLYQIEHYSTSKCAEKKLKKKNTTTTEL
ncbi:hypothetical protein CDAR_598211 [Caerostris darwini]|uniref:Uncharacterized protein n=1 Tax=Caerostris darwini TaxID=1538125 RepID=A0AAV4QJY9_9ARAC|nr:hypothetical protein CDAR_598211 [Caerostris darwini]